MPSKSRDRRGRAVLNKQVFALLEQQRQATGKTNISEIARMLKVDRSTIYRAMRDVSAPSAESRHEVEEQPDPVPVEDLPEDIKEMLEWGHENFLAFCEKFRLTGPKDLPGVPRHQREIARAIFAPENEHIIINIPPRHAKSEYWSVWFPIWLICRDRNNQIILVSKTADQAKKHARRIGFLLERHSQLIEVFGRFKPISTSLTWRPGSGELIVEGRTVTTVSGDLTLQIRGARQGILGMAAHYILADDVSNPENSRTGADREKLLEWWEGEVLSRMEPDCRVVVLGTRFGLHDLYGYLARLQYEEDLDDQVHNIKVWKHITFPAILDWEKRELLWPERFSWRYFMKKRSGNKSLFNAVYQQEPVSEGDVLARDEWIYGDEEHPGCLDQDRRIGDGLKRFQVPLGQQNDPQGAGQGLIPVVRVVSIDPAPVNYTAMTLADVPYVPLGAQDKSFHIHIIEVVRDRLGPREMAKHIDRWLESHGPIDYMIFERNIANRWVLQEPSWEKYQGLFRLISHETGKNKSDPAMGVLSLAEDFELGRIRIPYGDAEARTRMEPLVHEALTYPQGETDDVLMSIWFIKFQRDRLLPTVAFRTKQAQGRAYRVPRRLAKGYSFNRRGA